jgi:hypothetical protein
MAVREHQHNNASGSSTELLVSPVQASEHTIYAGSPSFRRDSDSEKSTQYEFIDCSELARRLAVPTSWVRDQVRSRSQDPLPHVNLGKYVRFLWGSPALELWICRRIVVGNNRRVERVP